MSRTLTEELEKILRFYQSSWEKGPWKNQYVSEVFVPTKNLREDQGERAARGLRIISSLKQQGKL